MTREEAIISLNESYTPTLETLEGAISAAQANYYNTRGEYEEKLRKINEYFDALESKNQLEEVIAQGLPPIN